MWTVLELLPAMICSAMGCAVPIGTAKPCVAVCDGEPETEPAVMIPTTFPPESTRAPPESPGWIGASTWISPDSCSEVPLAESAAVMDWFRPVTVPATAVGVPPLPRALPTATTSSPTETVPESPSGAVFRPEAPDSFSTAMSCERS